MPTRDRSLSSDAVEFYDALQTLLRMYQFRDRNRVCQAGLTVTECYSLEVLVQDGPLSLNRLAASMSLDKSTLSRVVRSLGDKGYLKKLADPKDGRSSQIAANERGKRVYREIRQGLVRRQVDLLRTLSPGARRKFTVLLRQLAAQAEGPASEA
jgi:MarR family 2-MHQ and catechol resistance regulon transcriptional repressor